MYRQPSDWPLVMARPRPVTVGFRLGHCMDFLFAVKADSGHSAQRGLNGWSSTR